MSLLNVILIILGFIVYSPDVYKSKYKSACNIKTTNIGYTTKYGDVSMSTYSPAAAANDGIYNCYSSHVSVFNSPKIYSPCTPARLETPLTNSMQRVIGYDSNGNKIDTDGNGNPSDPSKGMWESGYEYYYEDGYWYRTNNGGRSWQKWSTLFDWGLVIWNWRSGRPPSGTGTYYYKDNPVPLDNAGIVLLLLLFSYFNIHVKKKIAIFVL